VENFADQETLDSLNIDNKYDLLGLYRGIPIPSKSKRSSDLQDRIFLYRCPLIRYAREYEHDINTLTRHVLLHEMGHHFGASLSSPLLLAMMLMILPLQFTALAAKHWPHYMEVACYWLGFALCPVLAYAFGRYNLLLTPFAIGLALVLFEDWKNKRDQPMTKEGATS
jgi:hypothetical protein